MDQVQWKRTKHIEIHMYYIRDLVLNRSIVLQYCSTDEQVVDIFTKNFTEKNFTYLYSLLGVSSSGWLVTSLVFTLRGGFVPTGFSPFFSLSICFSILELLLYRVTYGLCFQGPIIFFTPPHEYSVSGGVGVIIQPTHLYLVNLAYLPTYPKYWLELLTSTSEHQHSPDISISAPAQSFNQGG